MAIPSKPIRLAAHYPSTLTQICSRSSLKPISASPHPLEELFQQPDPRLCRRQLEEPASRRLVAGLRQPPVDLARLSDQALLHIQLGQRCRHPAETITLQAGIAGATGRPAGLEEELAV